MERQVHHIAVVDDEDDLRDAVVEYLNMNGYAAIGFARPALLRQAIDAHPFDLAILDVAMPGEDGLSLARWLRSRGRMGLIFATAAGTSIDRIVGLELGADDYLVKPFELRELLARVRSVLRRVPADHQGETAAPAKRPAAAPSTVRFSGFVLDLSGGTLTRSDGSRVDLTAKEFELLQVLASRPGRTLSRAQILELAPGSESGDAQRAVDIRITRLRRKIEPVPDAPRHIRTIRGEGYAFFGD